MRRISLISMSLALMLGCPSLVKAQACPQDVETLMPLMLKDLPSYANRVIQRSMEDRRDIRASSNYVIIVGQPEFAPLPLKIGSEFERVLPNDVEQVFFTTLERQYSSNRVTRLENFYWLFLTPTPEGWYMVTLYSQLASLFKGDVPLPPDEVSQGIIGTAIALWLRDCRAGVKQVGDQTRSDSSKMDILTLSR